jgi:hypothetical protein
VKIYTDIEVCRLLCCAKKKWGMYFKINTPDDEQHTDSVDATMSAAPYLKGRLDSILDGNGFILFDTKKEAWATFNLTVGDDGPTKTNPYKGRGTVYALLFNAKGLPITENT